MKLSIIVPVYKVEHYLRQCVDSILAQTFTDFELILVDDGSPDNCPMICDEYEQKDCRVRVIHQKNKGVSSARNTGIENAKGECIVFCDSDDYVDSQYLHDMIIAQAGNPNTLVVADLQYSTDTDADLKQGYAEIREVNLTQLSKEAYSEFFLKYKLWGPCCKVYSTEIIKKNGIRFNTCLKSAEDFYFNMQYLKMVSSFIYVPVAHYHYRIGWKSAEQPPISLSMVSSLHIVAEELVVAASRGRVLDDVYDGISYLIAEKLFWSRMPSFFLPVQNLPEQERRKLFHKLFHDSDVFSQLILRGKQLLPLNPVMRMIAGTNAYIVWKYYYKLYKMLSVIRKGQR